jgi:hypothetical protein
MLPEDPVLLLWEIRIPIVQIRNQGDLLLSLLVFMGEMNHNVKNMDA